MKNPTRLRLAAALMLAGVACLSPAQSARAQDNSGDALGGIGESGRVTVRASVVSVDVAARKVALRNQAGETVNVTVPEGVANLAAIRPGDVVTATMIVSVTFVQAQPGLGSPAASTTVAGGRVRDGAARAGAVGEREVRSVVVVAVNPAQNTITVVNTAGGPVRTLHVRDPRLQQALPNVRQGATITMIGTEVFAISLTPG
jgi:hypothetical protein